MSKELLSITNVDSGRLIEKVDDAIISANNALDATGKGTAKVVIEIALKAVGEDGMFREVSTAVSVKAPPAPKKVELLPVQRVDGVRGVVVDTSPVPEQTNLIDLAEKRTAVS